MDPNGFSVAPGYDLLEPPLHAAAITGSHVCEADFSSQGPKVQASHWIYCGGNTDAPPPLWGRSPPKSHQAAAGTFILHVPARVEGR